MAIVALIGIGIFIGSGIIWCFTSTSSPICGTKTKKKRAMSFNSKVMVNGGFPDKAQVAQPIINAALFFKNCPSPESIEALFRRLLTYDRFRCPTRKVGNDWEFYEVDNIDIMKNHIVNIEVGSELELKDEIDRVCSMELTNDRPMWQVCRIVNKGSGLSAMVIRIHHVIGDGIALVSALSKLFMDTETGKILDLNVAENMRKADKAGRQSTCGLVCNVMGAFFKVLGLALSPYDTDTKFTSVGDVKKNLAMTPHRKTVYLPTVRLDFIKAIKNKAGVTINDVLLAVVTGAIRRYCEKKNDPAMNNKEILSRVLLPVAFPRPKEDLERPSKALRNKWSFISVPIPLAPMSSQERLSSCNATTLELKQSPIAFVQLWVQSNLLPLLPLSMQRKTAHDIFSRHTLVFSNVPGPPNKVTFAEEPLEALQCIFPNILPQILILSYGGNIFTNMSIDPVLVEDGDTLLSTMFEVELLELATNLGVQADAHMMYPNKSPGGVLTVLD